MKRVKHNLQIFVLVFLMACQASGGVEDLPFWAGILNSQNPVITTISPRSGSPAQNNPGNVLPASTLTISGSNLGDLTSQVIFPGGAIATPRLNNGTQLLVDVPSTARSGILSVVRAGGGCTPDGRSGNACVGTEFFVDCYIPYNNFYGTEIVVEKGKEVSINYNGNQTFAFRSKLTPGASTLSVSCTTSLTNLRIFNSSCSSTDFTLARNPSIPVNGGNFGDNISIQFFVSAGSDTCQIRIN